MSLEDRAEALSGMMREWLTAELPAHGLDSRDIPAVVQAMDGMLVWKDGLAEIGPDLVERACEQVAQQLGQSRGTC